MTTPTYIAFTAPVRASMGIRSVTATKDHPSGLVAMSDSVYALNKIKIFIPKLGDATMAAEYPFDEASFAEYFSEGTPAVAVAVDPAILTYDTFDAPRRTQLGVRLVRAVKVSPVGLWALNDQIYAQKKFAVFIPDPNNLTTKACRFDVDGGLFDQYFVDV